MHCSAIHTKESEDSHWYLHHVSKKQKWTFLQYPLYFPTSYLHFGLNNTDFSLHLFMPSNQLFHTFHIFPIIQCLYQYTLDGAVGCANGEDGKKQKDHILILSNSLLLNFFVLSSECSYCLLNINRAPCLHSLQRWNKNSQFFEESQSYLQCLCLFTYKTMTGMLPCISPPFFSLFFHIPKQPNISH